MQCNGKEEIEDELSEDDGYQTTQSSDQDNEESDPEDHPAIPLKPSGKKRGI